MQNKNNIINLFGRIISNLTLKRLTFLSEIFSVFTAFYVIAQFLPAIVLNNLPATGGDTGSHFWPVKVLHDFGIPNLVARPWNPGNNGGEGLLVHYFPLPFILMGLFSYLIPVGLAFNLGTILPVVSLPISVWAGLRVMALPFPAPILASIFSSAVVLNEGYSMWGGNTLSTLAGQFAHMYALNFLILGLGVFWRELNKRELPWKSGILFSAVALSHGYIYFGIPLLILLIALVHPMDSFIHRFKLSCLSGLISALLSIWFLGPMILSNFWVTPHSFSWVFQDWTQEVLPRIFDPIIVLSLISILAIAYQGLKTKNKLLIRATWFWFGAGVIYLCFFFVFRWLKLVDVRAIPQTQLFWAITTGILVATALSSLSKKLELSVIILIIGLLFPWEGYHVVKFPIWMNWNYSGWKTKPKYQELVKLSESLHGNLSEPRVAYEHHVKNNSVGTERVFEMLPYFANRATTESLYLQSTILAPMIYSFTSEISQNASCPFHNWPCMKFGLKQAEERMELLGIKELILSSDISLKTAAEAPFLRKRMAAGPWTIFETVKSIPMAETFSSPPITVSLDDWKERAWRWFKEYERGKVFLVAAESETSLPSSPNWIPGRECHPTTTVDFSGIYLKTDCPGYAHYLKYAYHPSFTSSGGEPLFLVSPGFLGIVPQAETVKLSFGSSWQWALFRWISIFSTILIVIIIFTQRKTTKNKVLSDASSINNTQSYSVPKIKTAKAKTDSENKKYFAGKFWFWGLLALFSCSYIIISQKTDSFLFWNWRQLNFRDFEIINSHQDWGTLHKNEDLNKNPIIVKGTIYHAGLGTHANSEIKIRLKKSPGILSGKCGYPDYANGANIQCQIRTPKEILFASSPLNNQNREQNFRIAYGNERELILSVKTLKNDITAAHAVWVDLVTLH